MAHVKDIVSLGGNTCMGPVYTFSKMINLNINPAVQMVQTFYGNDSFLVDMDPLPNSGISTAHEFTCKKCNSLIGWKLLEPDRLLCLRYSIF